MQRLIASCFALAVALGALGCAGDVDGPSIESGDEEIRRAPDGSHALFLGKWESVMKNVPATGGLPFESNIRSLEFSSDRDDSRSYTRYRLVLVIRPDCDTCRDETFPEGTYRSIADSGSNLKRGKLYVTEGGNTSSRDFYEIDGDTLKLTATGLGGDSRTVVREFRRVR